METLVAIIALLMGALGGAFIARRLSQGRTEGELAALQRERETERTGWEQRLREVELRGQETQAELRTTAAALASEQERNRNLMERLARQKEEVEALHTQMTDRFKAIAGELLESKGRQLTEQQHERLGTLLKPLHDRIREFEEQVRKTYESEGRERFALKQEILRLVEQNQRLSQDADNLTRALKGDTQAQGAWGEMLLEKLLENSGLVKGQEYVMQESTTLADGTRLRPDAVVMLPEGKHLVIDSKVSLVHYERFTASTDDIERERLLRQHVDSLRAHAKGLAAKDYGKLYGAGTVDFILMFVPLEPAFLLALRERPEIFQEAYDRQVVMVTHTTLMATLRTIHGIWRNERIARNHQEIAERAGKLYSKFADFADDLLKVGKRMDEAKEAYGSAMSKLAEGSGNLVRQVEMLKELGAKTTKGIDRRLLERAGARPGTDEEG